MGWHGNSGADALGLAENDKYVREETQRRRAAYCAANPAECANDRDPIFTPIGNFLAGGAKKLWAQAKGALEFVRDPNAAAMSFGRSVNDFLTRAEGQRGRTVVDEISKQAAHDVVASAVETGESFLNANQATQEQMIGGGAVIALEILAPLASTSRALPAIPNTVNPLEAAGALRALAVDVHSLVDPFRLRKSAVAVAEIQMNDGTTQYWAAGSGGRLSAQQRQLLFERGIDRVASGTKFHAEQNIASQLPEGSSVRRWGISWTTPQKPIPCKVCAPMVDFEGGVVER